MMTKTWRINYQRVACLILAGLALANSGCLALVAGSAAAAGGAAGYAYYKGKVGRVYAANFDDVWAATHTSLTELGMSVQSENRTKTGGSMESRTTSESVQITLETQESKIPAEGPVTLVSIRVGTFGDERVSYSLLDQIGRHLVPVQAGTNPASQPAVLQPTTWTQPVESPPPPVSKDEGRGAKDTSPLPPPSSSPNTPRPTP
jgi:hypothetical protein